MEHQKILKLLNEPDDSKFCDKEMEHSKEN